MQIGTVIRKHFSFAVKQTLSHNSLPFTYCYPIAFTINKAAFDHEGLAVGVATLWGYF